MLSIGILLGMISIGAYYLCYLRKKENKYYKKITWLDNWYHRFFYNINMSFIITEFIILKRIKQAERISYIIWVFYSYIR